MRLGGLLGLGLGLKPRKSGSSGGGGGTLLLDTFTGSSRLSVHTPDTGAFSWVEVDGAWSVGGGLAKTTSNGGPVHCRIDPGVADVTLSVKIYSTVSNEGIGVLCNYVDQFSHWLWWLAPNFSTLSLYEGNGGGGYTLRGSWSGEPLSNGATLVVTTNGDTISARYNGGTLRSYSVGSRAYKTATKVGLRIYAPDGTNDAFDDLTVTV